MERETEQTDQSSAEPSLHTPSSPHSGKASPPKLGLLGRQKKCRNLLTLVAKERLEAESEGSTADSSPWAID